MHAAQTNCVCCTAGLTSLQSLSLINCELAVSIPHPGWERLRQLTELDLRGRYIFVDMPSEDAGAQNLSRVLQ